MPSMCLINFNARIYDPTIGRFMSADSVTQDVYNLQVLNRYSYCGNNPLSFTDPSGNLFGIDDILLAEITAAVLTVAAPLLHIPILGDLAIVAAAIACGPLGPVCAGGSAAVQAGLSGGNIGDIIAAFALTSAQAAMFQGFGRPLASGTSWTMAGRAIMAGMIGGIVSAGRGGNFGSGFLSAGVSMLTAPIAGSLAGEDKIGGTLINAVMGGAASVLGGGKFANGAVTGAFAYLAATCAAGGCDGESRKTLRADTINGSEIPDEKRREIIDQDIATFRAQGGHTLLGWMENDYDVYVVVNAAYVSDERRFSTLAEANSFMSDQMKLGNVHEWVSGETYFNVAHIYATAAYPLDNAYGDPVVPQLYGLYVVWHENGHQSSGFTFFWGGVKGGIMGGGGCGADEGCANSWAYQHYQLPSH